MSCLGDSPPSPSPSPSPLSPIPSGMPVCLIPVSLPLVHLFGLSMTRFRCHPHNQCAMSEHAPLLVIPIVHPRRTLVPTCIQPVLLVPPHVRPLFSVWVLVGLSPCGALVPPHVQSVFLFICLCVQPFCMLIPPTVQLCSCWFLSKCSPCSYWFLSMCSLCSCWFLSMCSLCFCWFPPFCSLWSCSSLCSPCSFGFSSYAAVGSSPCALFLLVLTHVHPMFSVCVLVDSFPCAPHQPVHAGLLFFLLCSPSVNGFHHPSQHPFDHFARGSRLS